MRSQPTEPRWTSYLPTPPALLLLVVAGLGLLLALVSSLLSYGILPGARSGWIVVIAVLGVLTLVGVGLMWRAVLAGRIGIRLTADEFQARRGSGAPLAVAWSDIRRVQRGYRSLLFDVTTPDGPRQLVVEAPVAGFPDDALCGRIGARLDASRGYQTTMCQATGEPGEEAMVHGGCDSPLGCASQGSCAVAALKGASGTTAP